MSKPQLASEPSMEEILASIRKMITDDKPGPSPLPDQMGRTPFGEPAQASPVSEFRARETGTAAPSGGTQPTSFNSLADALKVATTISEPRRSLQQEIASVIEKGQRGGRVDPLAELGKASLASNGRDRLHSLPETRSSTGTEPSGPQLPKFPDWRGDASSGAPSDSKRELMSFDFGTLVPHKDDRTSKVPFPGDEPAKSAAASAGADAASSSSAKADGSKTEPSSGDAARVLSIPSRSSSSANGSSLSGNGSSLNGSSLNGAGLNGSGAGLNGAGLNGSAPVGSGVNGATVAPFPRSLREPAKPAAVDLTPSSVEKSAEKTGDKSAAKSEAGLTGNTGFAASAAQPSALSSAKSEAASAKAEALLDAVVDLVQQQPGSLSVFTSGASFIGGVAGKALAAAKSAASSGVEAPLAAATGAAADVSGTPGVPAKLDGAAAELLRPMLRQWLADNMPRIVEEALRSEMTGQTQDGDKADKPDKA